MPQPCYLITIANIQHFLIRTNNLLVFFDKKMQEINSCSNIYVYNIPPSEFDNITRKTIAVMVT